MWAMQAAVMATLLGAATVVAGCGDSGSGGSADEPVSTSGPATTVAAGSGIRACTLLSLEEVEALAGSPVTAGPTPNNGRDGCEWTAEVVDDAGVRGSHVVDLQLQSPSVALAQALTIDGEPAPVEGLGDEAAIEQSTANVPGVMAGYRDQDRVVTLRYQAQEITSGVLDPRSRADALVETLRIVSTRTSAPS